MDRDEAVGAVGDAMSALRGAQRDLDEAVRLARACGATWSQIGDAAGMSRQSAHERWGHLQRAGCHRQDCDCADHTAGPCDCGHGPGRGRGRTDLSDRRR